MADRGFNPVKTFDNEIVMIKGRFYFNGTSSPATVYGKGFTVARSGVGLYTITFTDRFPELHSVNFGFANATGTVQAHAVITGSVVGGSATNTLSFTYCHAATPTDPAAAATNWMSFEVQFRNTAINQ